MTFPISSSPAMTTGGNLTGHAVANSDIGAMLQIMTQESKSGHEVSSINPYKALAVVCLVVSIIGMVGIVYYDFDLWWTVYDSDLYKNWWEKNRWNNIAFYLMGLLGAIGFALSHKEATSMLQTASDVLLLDDDTAAAWADYTISMLSGLSDSIRKPTDGQLSALQTRHPAIATSFQKFAKEAVDGEFGHIARLSSGASQKLGQNMNDIFKSRMNGTLPHTIASQRRELSILLQKAVPEVAGHLSKDRLRSALASLPARDLTNFLHEAVPSTSEGDIVLDIPTSYKIGTAAGLLVRSMGAQAGKS